MVLSCLVEPLVSPLVGRGTSGVGRRTALRRSRFAATALAASALLAAATCVDVSALRQAETHEASAARPAFNAHKRPDAIPYRVVLAEFARRADEDLVAAPAESTSFDTEAVFAHRLRHARSLDRDSGPGLGRARQVDRLRRSVALSFSLHSSGVLRSGAASPTHV